MQSTAVLILQEAEEAFKTDVFSDTNLYAIHGKRVTIFLKDMALTCCIQGIQMNIKEQEQHLLSMAAAMGTDGDDEGNSYGKRHGNWGQGGRGEGNGNSNGAGKSKGDSNSDRDGDGNSNVKRNATLTATAMATATKTEKQMETAKGMAKAMEMGRGGNKDGDYFFLTLT